MKNLSVCILFLSVLAFSLGCTPKESASTSRHLPFDTTAEIKSHRHLLKLQKQKQKLKTENQWDSLNNSKLLKVHKQKLKRRKDYKVYGWHTYYEGSAYKNHNFSLLYGVIYFSYELNPKTGGYTDIHSWKTTALVDSAKAHNCKVYLSVTNFGSKNNHTFLSDNKAQKNFVKNLISLLDLRGADGVVLDFENIPGDDRDLFSGFVVNLSRELKKHNSRYTCILCLYAIDYHKVFDINTIDNSIDEYILMGYDFYGSFSSESGPVAPLHDMVKGMDYSLEYAINAYLKKGIAQKKLIVGLPYYGAKWVTESPAIPSKVDDFISSPPFFQVEKEILSGDTNVGYDLKCISRYLVEEKNKKIRQTWFDDSTTLALKYDWVKYKELGGVAPWTLNYSGNYNSLWQLLNEEFGDNSSLDSRNSTAPNKSKHKKLARTSTSSYFLKTKFPEKANSDKYKKWKYKPSVKHYKNIRSDYTIYGFYPFWNDNKEVKIDFGLYSRIAYFAALPDAKTGKIKHSFNWNSLDIQLAHKHGCKVDLVIASPDEEESSVLLKNQTALSTLTTEILNLVGQAKADGVTLDFGQINLKDRKNFVRFIKGLHDSIRTRKLNYKLNCILPPLLTKENHHFAFDFEKLNLYFDYYLLSGFDYHGITSNLAGPNAPLYSGKIWPHYDINSSTLKYISLGVPSEKFILVVPYFGEQWTTKDNRIPSKVTGKVKFIDYTDFHSQVTSASKRYFDKNSLTPCYIVGEKGKTVQTWIDDAQSLGLKYDYIKKNKLAGAGIWAIGYDGDQQELTNVLIDHFETHQQKDTTGSNKKNFVMKLSDILPEIGNIEAVLWIVDGIAILFIINVILLSLKICFFRSLLNRFIIFFYGLGILVFILTYFLLRQTKMSNDDGTIAIAAFIVIASLILVKRTRDTNIKKGFP